MKRVQLNGTDIEYEVRGSGAPVWVIPVRSGDRIHQARIPAAKNLFRTKTTSHLEP